MAIGDPTGADLTSGTTSGDTLPVGTTMDDFEDREITFSTPISLVSGVKYAIVIRAVDAGGLAELVIWHEKASGTYADGVGFDSFNSGSSWADHSGDLWFITKASGVTKDSYQVAGDATSPIWGVNWESQTFTTTSAYTISSVVLRLARGADSPGTLTVSIRQVEGETYLPSKATTPVPTNANTSVTLDQATIAWTDGGDTDTFDVYYGTESGSLTKVSDAQAGASFTVTGITDGSPYSYLSVRYWRIDSTNAAGTTTGDEWSFITIRIDPPTKTYFYSATGQHYYLLIQSDGTYGDPPGVGVENTDYVFLAAGHEFNAIATTRILVSCANSKVWFEDI